MNEVRSRLLLRIAAVLVLPVAMTLTPGAHAAPVSCGDILTENTVLTADLTCDSSTDALIIAADNVTLNLNGHTISGPGAYATPWAAIRVFRQSGVTIKNGAATGFQAGVVLDEAAGVTVTHLEAHHNDLGINLAGGGGHTIEKNVAHDNGRDGIRLGLSADNRIAKNTVLENHYGITVADNSSGNLVEKNDLVRNVAFGIAAFAGATDTRIEKNYVVDTTWHGIHVTTGTTASTLEKNDVRTSGQDGIRVESSSASITKNTADRNGDLGISAVPGVVDGGGNKARANGNPAQCVGVYCK